MPYIITTTPKYTGQIAEPLRPYAVATLDEAREEAANVIRRKWNVLTPDNPHFHATAAEAARDALALPECGGTIGPLPDGTVIEVEHVSLADLAEAAGGVPVRKWTDAANVIDAYNQRN